MIKSIQFLLATFILVLIVGFLYIFYVSPSNKVFEPNDTVNGIGYYFAGYEKEEVPFACYWRRNNPPDSIFIEHYAQGRFPHYGMSRTVRIFNIDSIGALNFITKHGGEITTEWAFDQESKYYHFKVYGKKSRKEFNGIFHAERRYAEIDYTFAHNWK